MECAPGRRAEKDDDVDEIADQVDDGDDQSPSEPEDEAERRRKKKGKKAKDDAPVTDDDQETPADPSKRYPEGSTDAAYWRAVNAIAGDILKSHATATGRVEPISHADADYARILAAASGEHGSYEARVKAVAHAIVAVHRKVRGL